MSGRKDGRSSNTRDERSRSDEQEYDARAPKQRRQGRSDRDDYRRPDSRDQRDASYERFGSRSGSHKRYNDESDDERMESLSDRMERLFHEQSTFIARTVSDTVSREMASVKAELRSLHEKIAEMADSHESLANRVAALEDARAREAFESVEAGSGSRPTNASARVGSGDPD